MDNFKELTQSPQARLREVAEQMEKGEVRSFYLVTCSKSGFVTNTAYVTPNVLEGPNDMLSIGNACLETAEAAHRTLQKGISHG